MMKRSKRESRLVTAKFDNNLGLKSEMSSFQFVGSGLDITVHEVKFFSGLWVNLFSIVIALRNDYHLRNQGLSIFLSKVSVSVTFDRVMRATNGSVSWIRFLVNESPVVYNILSA
jgi:hypothetical protein